jgi:hypothetical protein
LTSSFLEAQTYYSVLAQYWNAQVDNTRYYLLYSTTLVIKALDSKCKTLYAHIPKSVWNSQTNVQLEGVDPDGLQEIVIVITDSANNTDPVVFGPGAEFPYTAEKTVFVFPGSGAPIHVLGGMRGSILAPQRNFYQPHGVTRGFLILGNVTRLHQANKPVCIPCENPCGNKCCDDDQHCWLWSYLSACAPIAPPTQIPWLEVIFCGLAALFGLLCCCWCVGGGLSRARNLATGYQLPPAQLNLNGDQPRAHHQEMPVYRSQGLNLNTAQAVNSATSANAAQASATSNASPAPNGGIFLQ